MSESRVVYFQDYFSETSVENEVTPDEAFFELANAPVVGFKIHMTTHQTSHGKGNEDNSNNESDVGNKGKDERKFLIQKEVHIRQLSDCQSHTGGIVWETSYLLAMYLRFNYQGSNSLGKVLEVGAGCGMLGLILAASDITKKVVMTETTEVLPNLEQNVERNISPIKSGDETSTHEKNQHTNRIYCCSSNQISVRSLRWDKFNKDIRKCERKGSTDLKPHSFDTIVGTDVIFSTTLVKPLLKTLRIMSKPTTNTYLCVQIRCEDSHALFLKKASKYGFRIRECTDDLKNIKSLKWGIDLDCKLLHLCLEEDSKTHCDDRTKKKRKRCNGGDKKAMKTSKK